MKKILYSMMIAAAVLTGCATTGINNTSNNLSEEDLSSSKEIVLTVHGLSCPLCSNNLDGQLKRIDGVERAEIDLKTGDVTVLLEEKHSVTSSDFENAVKNAGFTLKSIEPKDSKE